MMCKKFFETHQNIFYVVFRILVGLMFFGHGAQKIFGWFTDRSAVELGSLMGAAGIIEVVAGLGIAIGLFARLLAVIGALEMIVAYFMAHAGSALVPLMNGGEAAVLYFVAFLVVAIHGAKAASLETFLMGKEHF